MGAVPALADGRCQLEIPPIQPRLVQDLRQGRLCPVTAVFQGLARAGAQEMSPVTVRVATADTVQMRAAQGGGVHCWGCSGKESQKKGVGSRPGGAGCGLHAGWAGGE